MRCQESYDISTITTGSTLRCQESYDISAIKFGGWDLVGIFFPSDLLTADIY